MQYKCSACEDTGNLSKHLAGNLDCTSCSAATDRAAMNSFLDKHQSIGDYDAAWILHQRALAMAPKQVRRPVHEENARHAIDAAILFGRNGTNKPPTGDHWLMQYWNMGAQLAIAPKQEVPEQKPVGMVAKSSFASHKVLVATAQLDDVPLGAKLYLAAPAAANSAMPELPEIQMDHLNVLAQHYTADQMRAYGQACAAAGPNAVLVKDLTDAQLDELQKQSYNRNQSMKADIYAFGRACYRAALSGAKGNA